MKPKLLVLTFQVIAFFMLPGKLTFGQDTEKLNLIKPAADCSWLESDGIRAAWLSYKQIDDAMVGHLLNARVNTVFLKHGMHDFLAMETAQWKGDRIFVETRDVHLPRMIENTRRAAAAGIHVFWLANFELKEMLPHLVRLGYQKAFAEGPARYLRAGEQQDAAPLDPVFWRGITGAHGELIARLSLKYPIEGIIYDTEHYAGGMMYLQNSGFSDPTFEKYAVSRALDITAESVPKGTRYEHLKSTGRLLDYYLYLEEEAVDQGKDLANRWHAINPHLLFGIWPLLDNWFSRGTLRGLGGAVPSLGLSGAEYYHGSDSSKSLAEFFESKCPNVKYLPGFYPPYSYSVDQLHHHVAQALRSTRGYWMLGPHEELSRSDYQTALRSAFESVEVSPSADHAPVNIEHRIDKEEAGPFLTVSMTGAAADSRPLLSLYTKFGGAPLCKNQPMEDGESGYIARIPLLRLISNNRHQSHGFRSGATYSFSPVPRELFYEDPQHTKLFDGRSYGFFGTTVAWSKATKHSSVTFDLHRPLRLARVELSQSGKLEDRIGGPTNFVLSTALKQNSWSKAPPFKSYFSVTLKDVTEPDTTSVKQFDKRHDRAWLSWRVDLNATESRWLRLDLENVRPNSSISLGEVAIWAIFEGDIVAEIETGGKELPIRQGKSWEVSVPQ